MTLRPEKQNSKYSWIVSSQTWPCAESSNVKQIMYPKSVMKHVLAFLCKRISTTKCWDDMKLHTTLRLLKSG